MPCPTAIAPLIISGVHDSFNYALLHILIYVTGMTFALFIFTGVLLLMKSFFQRRLKHIENKVNFNFVSALIMIGIGVVYLAINILSQDQHLHL